ncbi:MAG: peptide chain release factor N(5)-glutamine methyltransferase [Rhizomicrobium sp.]|nr:peptide chain release factor N(5)-glutamine methyltransferase [Rhizomicrobium sp.]
MSDLLREATARLAAAGVDNPRLDARVLWEAVGGDAERFESFIARRAAREPVAYITGWKEFWSLSFAVAPGILIPRPDTETIIDAVLADYPDRSAPLNILDLGTGSGCILAALLSEYPNAHGLGIDSSEIAQNVAAGNLERLGLGARGAVRAGNWAEKLDTAFDIVVSNPPYIPTADIADLEPDVRDFEPSAALDGGPDGLDAVRILAPELKKLGGVGYIEIGVGQDEAAAAIFTKAGLAVLRVARDLGGVPRIVIVRAKKELE